MGLWMIQNVRREHEKKYSWGDYVVMSKAVKGFDSIVDVNDQRFLAPESMIAAIQEYCRETNQKVPETPGEIALCVYDSLAVCYAKAVKTIESITGYKFETIHIVGGGSMNGYLNELTAKRTGLKVMAGPVEATAIGNIIAQLLYDGAVKTIDEAKEKLNGVTLESLVVISRVAKAVKILIDKGILNAEDFPLLLHADEILTEKKPVDLPWEKFAFRDF